MLCVVALTPVIKVCQEINGFRNDSSSVQQADIKVNRRGPEIQSLKGLEKPNTYESQALTDGTKRDLRAKVHRAFQFGKMTKGKEHIEGMASTVIAASLRDERGRESTRARVRLGGGEELERQESKEINEI